MSDPLRPPLVLLATLLSAAPLAGQATLALAREPAARPAAPGVPRAAWEIRLASDWPQYLSGAGCVNGGSETLSGTLALDGAGRYVGRLTRAATIRFCGRHGQAAEACSLTLTSHGVVEAVGQLHAEGATTLLTLGWSAAEGHPDAAVSGDCPPAFQAAVQRLYLSVAHALELPLPSDGGPHTVRLDDYGWIAELR